MPLLEVIVSSVEDAVEAERGGAGRLEVCCELDREGVSPPLAMVREIVARVRIPIRVMLRERETFDIASDAELERLCADAGACEAVGVQGLVIGFERAGRIDHAPLAALIGAAPSCRVTFHRALEATADPLAALAELKRYPQVDRVLVGGGAGAWEARLARINEFARAGAPQIGVLPGAGIDAGVLRTLAAAGVAEAHVGRAAREHGSATGRVVADKVAALVAAFNGAN